MSRIHPTAIIHPDAQIAGDVAIGPYACIEGPAKIGAGTAIHAHAVLSGDVTLGERNVIGHGAVIGTFPQDLSFKPETRSGVVIGNDNVIRELVSIHRGTGEGTFTRVGDGNFLMVGAHLGHNVHVGNRAILANNVLLGGYVEVGDRVFIGGGSVFHQFVRVGTLALSQGISGAAKSVPPYCVLAGRTEVAGLNFVGMRRAGMPAERREEIKRAFKLLYRSDLNTSQAIEKARETEWSPEAQIFWDFVAAPGRKGFCGLATRNPGT